MQINIQSVAVELRLANIYAPIDLNGFTSSNYSNFSRACSIACTILKREIFCGSKMC